MRLKKIVIIYLEVDNEAADNKFDGELSSVSYVKITNHNHCVINDQQKTLAAQKAAPTTKSDSL